nr:unnamed protein product [Callosobruchus analis]
MNLEDSGGSLGLGGETIYGTHEDSHVVMSEKVQSLAGSIYQEFERMIAQYDEDVVKTLMPLLVNVLECLDAAYQQNQEHDVELELLREDNEQLVTQYEREKGARKAAEQKLLEYEDAAEAERKELSTRLEALESIVRMLELKHKNSMEHASRLEEREGELKKEYAKLHERYTELFKTHVEYMERTKLLHSGQQLASERAEAGRLNSLRNNIGRSSGPISFGFTSLENAENVDSVPSSPISSTHSSPSLHSELDNMNSSKDDVLKVERGQATDSLNLENKSVVTSPMSPPAPQQNNNSRLNTKKEQRSGNTLYQELSYHDDGDEDNSDITGMGKEVENLIMENNELLATKNALNVVKDDLIVKVDELTGEIDMLREEILSLNLSRTKLRERVADLEEELKKVKEANEARQEADEESDVPLAQRKRFTRVEMARVLMERNQYKERFMELQEAVRFTEMLRASKSDTPFEKQHNKSIWRFFSDLFSGGGGASGADRIHRPVMPASYHVQYKPGTGRVAPGVKALPRIAGPGGEDIETGPDKLAVRKALERREQYRQVRAHVRKEDGRLHAYGWSLPDKCTTTPGKPSGSGGGGVPVPVPVYCRPLAETTPEMKIWCAAGVNLQGGYTKDGGLMVGGSVFYSAPSDPKHHSPTVADVTSPQSEMETLDRELEDSREGALLETKLSSLVWICTTTQSATIVTVIDANNPAELLNSFGVCSKHVLCIASVPGASPSDYYETIPKTESTSDIQISKEYTYNKDVKNNTSEVEEPQKTESKPSEPKPVEEATQEVNAGPISKRALDEQEEAAVVGFNILNTSIYIRSGNRC